MGDHTLDTPNWGDLDDDWGLDDPAPARLDDVVRSAVAVAVAIAIRSGLSLEEAAAVLRHVVAARRREGVTKAADSDAVMRALADNPRE